MSDETRPDVEPAPSELEREERRLERLRLITSAWPPLRRVDDSDPDPQEAA